MTARRILHVFLAIALIAASFTAWDIANGSGTAAAASVTLVKATRGIVLSSVTGTGNITAATTDLSFRSSASSQPVTVISATLGEQVAAGQELARVDDTVAQATLTAAQAQLTSAQASLTQLQRGETSQQLAQDQAGLAQSQVGLDNAGTSYNNAVATANQDAVVAQTAVNQAQATLTTDQAALAAAQATLVDAQNGVPGAPSIPDAQAAVAAVQGKVTQDQNALTNAQNSLASGHLRDQQSITGAAGALNSAKAGYQSSVAGNAVKQAPPTSDKVAQAQASVVNAQNAVATANQGESDTVLVAPFAGTVTALNGDVGLPPGSASTTTGAASSSGGSGSGSSAASSSSSSSSSAFVTLTDLTHLQVKVGFSETDASRIKAGQAASFTLAAFSGRTLTGKVTSLDANSTVVSNVVTYYTVIDIDPQADITGVKPGMTTQVTIVVANADNVVMLPVSAVTAQGTQETMTVHTTDGKVETRTVTFGLRGDQSIQILTGLAAGESVEVAQTTGVGTSVIPGLGRTSTTTRTGGGLGGGLGGGGFGGPGG